MGKGDFGVRGQLSQKFKYLGTSLTLPRQRSPHDPFLQASVLFPPAHTPLPPGIHQDCSGVISSVYLALGTPNSFLSLLVPCVGPLSPAPGQASLAHCVSPGPAGSKLGGGVGGS